MVNTNLCFRKPTQKKIESRFYVWAAVYYICKYIVERNAVSKLVINNLLLNDIQANPTFSNMIFFWKTEGFDDD